MGHLEEIEGIVKRHLDAEDVDLHRKTRKRDIVLARQTIMKLAISNFYPDYITKSHAAEYFGRDHATGLHAEKAVQNLIDTDRNYRELYLELDTAVRQYKKHYEQEVSREEQKVIFENKVLTDLLTVRITKQEASIEFVKFYLKRSDPEKVTLFGIFVYFYQKFINVTFSITPFINIKIHINLAKDEAISNKAEP